MPWERFNLGFLIQSFILLIALLGFTILLHNFFYFFSEMKTQLISNNIRENEIDSILTKILLFDIFWDYASISNRTEGHIMISKERLKNSYYIQDNYSIGNQIYSDLTTLDDYGTGVNNNIIYRELVYLLNPLFFLSMIYLAKVGLKYFIKIIINENFRLFSFKPKIHY